MPEEVQDALVEALCQAEAGWQQAAGPVRLDLATAVSGEVRGHKRLELMGTCLCLTITLGNAQREPAVLLQEIRSTDPPLLRLLAKGL